MVSLHLMKKQVRGVTLNTIEGWNSNLGHICTANIQSVDSTLSLEPVFSRDRWKCSVALNEPYGLAGVRQQSVSFCTIDLD